MEGSNYYNFKAHVLFGHIDGTIIQPSEESADYLPWQYRDQALITLINATLSPSAFCHVTSATTTSELWESLKSRYSSKSRSNILALRSALYTVQKLHSETVDQFSRQVKDIVDKLAAAFCYDDEETLLHILNGLPSEYGPFRTSIRTRNTPITLGELEVLLDAEEKCINKSVPTVEITPTAMVAMSSRNFTNGGGNNHRSDNQRSANPRANKFQSCGSGRTNGNLTSWGSNRNSHQNNSGHFQNGSHFQPATNRPFHNGPPQQHTNFLAGPPYTNGSDFYYGNSSNNSNNFLSF